MTIEDAQLAQYREASQISTEWGNPPTLKELQQDVSSAQPDQQEETSRIRRHLDFLHGTGIAKPKVRKGRSSVVPKLIRKQAEWRYASLSEPFLSTGDLFNAYPVTFEDKEGARQNELVINHQFNNQIDKVRLIDRYVRAAVNEGTAIVRLGWEYEEEEQDVPEPVMVQAIVQGPQGPSVQMVPTGEVNMVRQTVVTKNQPTVKICRYDSVTVDPTCGDDLSKANFIAYDFETSKAELEADGRYQNIDAIVFDESGTPVNRMGDMEESSFTFQDDARKKFWVTEYWGYWDIDGSGMLKPIVCTWAGNVMIQLQENPFPGGFMPFEIVALMPREDSVYGEPDGALLEDNQRIIGAVTRGMIDVMARSANGQIGYRKDALDVSNKRKFEQGIDYAYNPSIADPRQAFHMHTYPEVPQSAQLMLQLQQMDADSMTGVKAFGSQGLTGNALGETATAVRGVLDAASKRELGILRRLADGLIRIGKKIVKMNQEFLSDQEIIRVTNSPDLMAIKREELAGEYDLRMTISTAEEDNAKAQELAFMLQTVGPNTDPRIAFDLMADIAELRKMPDTAQRLRTFEPQPDPMDVQLKQLEMQKLQAEIVKIQSETVENRAEAALDQAKVGTEYAKARQLESLADQQDLNFVEQESGVQQERELQKQGEQARANMQLEAVKAHLAPKPNSK